jgi:hypothetical protein
MSERAMSISSFLRYLALPARPVGLIFIGMLSIGFALCVRAGLLGLPLQLILLSWLFKYGYVLLEQVAHGAREPPVLAIEMLNPASEQRPLVQLALVSIVYLGLRAIARHISIALSLALEGLALAALPASIAVLGIGAPFWQAINPIALWRVARALGPTYAGIVAVVLVYGSAIAWIAVHTNVPTPLLGAGIVFAWLSVFSLLGGGLYEEREELGHEAMYTPERESERQQRELEQERSRFVDVVYAQARSGNLSGAWRTLEQELAARGHAFETYDWLLERLQRLDDQRLASRLAQDYIRRALARDNGRVTELVRARLALDAQFRPYSAVETLRVAELVRLAGDRASAQRLLSDFAQEFPDAPDELQVKAAALLNASSGIGGHGIV